MWINGCEGVYAFMCGCVSVCWYGAATSGPYVCGYIGVRVCMLLCVGAWVCGCVGVWCWGAIGELYVSVWS